MRNKDKRFDLDLAYGQFKESQLASVLGMEKDKVEVKSERNHWFNTGNIAIEIECRKKSSGVMATKADWWVHILDYKNTPMCMLVMKTQTVKYLATKYMSNMKFGGDDDESKFVLIPLKEIFEAIIDEKEDILWVNGTKENASR